MKMYRLLLLLGLLLPLTLSAQIFGGGVMAGLNMCQIDGDNDVGFRQPGMFLGGFLIYGLQEKLSLQPELVFEQLGSQKRGGGFSLRLNYTSLNLLLQGRIKLNFNDSTEQEIRVELGPAVGYQISASEARFGSDETDTFNRVDLRGIAGITLQLSEKWAFALRYGYSLSSIQRSSQGRNFYIDPAANGMFHEYVNFSLRYSFIQ